MVVLLASGCTPDDEAGDDPDAMTDVEAPADTDGLTIPELVREVGPQTVAIEISGEQLGQVVQGAGSGVIWSPDGVVVTNAHVVDLAEDIVVILADGARYPAELIASDPRTDLAVVRIDASGLTPAVFSEELPDIGELAVALGNPLGFQNTATAGIVSGIERTLPVLPDRPPLAGLIQTDAAISSGSSGGALVGPTGEIIGINVAVVEGDGVPGVAQGLGFAIPSTTVIPIVEQLLDTGEVAHAYLGIAGVPLTPQLAERFGLDRDRGVLVGDVAAGSPADDGGIEQGDIVTALAGDDVVTLGDLLGALRRFEPGDEVEVTVVRDGEEQTVEVVLGELPDDPAAGLQPAP
jgi:S1-C subfamily serine protease